MRRLKFLGKLRVAVIGCGLATAGCTVMNPALAPDSGYIEEPKLMAPWPERAAFVHRIWFKDRKQHYATRSRFTKICFAPTRTDFLSEPGRWNLLHSAGRARYNRDVRTMAKYMDDTLREVFLADPLKRFEVTESPDAETIVYEFAIVELRPTKVTVSIIDTLIGIFVPGGSLIKYVFTSKGSIAIELTARDGKNNEFLITAADRRVDQSSPCSMRDFEKYAHARKTVRLWAEELLKAWNTPDTIKIERPSVFTINPF